MKHIFLPVGIFISIFSYTNAQNASLQGSAPIGKTIDITDPVLGIDDISLYKIGEVRKPAGDYVEKKMYLNQQRTLKEKITQPKAASATQADDALAPFLKFTANGPNGTPNDNSVAISDSGFIVSVVNTNLIVYNDTGKQLLYRNLGSFASSLSLAGSISDPRVIFDPIHKKFIVAFFSGNNSTNSTIVLAFSKTSNPLSPWNFYKLNGNPNNDTTWSDYPIISITKDDFFITFNHLKDNEGWKTGFRYSAIWQIDKQRGFNGDSLKYNFYDKIKFNGKSVWSVCAVMKSGVPTDNKAYFLSVRPSDISNDTVFLHTISNSYQSGMATLTTTMYKTNLAYGLAPDAKQKDNQYLATNDARVLHAVELNNKIFYVQNCVQPSSGRAGIYLGTISNVNSSPSITGKIIAYDSLELGYPAISAIGSFPQDEKCVIYVNFVRKNGFAGCMALYKDKQNNISAPIILKEGEGNVNRLSDTIERWGDYSGIQQLTWDPTVVITAGYYGKSNSQHDAYIAKIRLNDSNSVAAQTTIPQTPYAFYPNPAAEMVHVEFEIVQSEKLDIALFDVQGKKVKHLLTDFYNPGKYHLQFNVATLPAGNYLLRIQQENSGEQITKSIVCGNR